MNKTLKLAVAGAVLAMSSAANAGITIPAGDWTIDIGGNVNGFMTMNSCDNKTAALGTVTGGLACNTTPTGGGKKEATNINTGLLPSAIGFGGKTRQNDLDVGFQFTFFPGIDSNSTTGGFNNSLGNNSLNVRQVFLTFGDKSWGTVKVGRDLGIFGSDAILNDMTLLGVGAGGSGSGNTTLGRIGTGYIYADWNAQISYASPNWNGFSFKAGVFDPWVGQDPGLTVAVANPDNAPQFQGQVSYDWAGDFAGKVWAGGIYQSFNANATNKAAASGAAADNAKGGEIGAHVDFGGFGVTAYGYGASGVGTTGFGRYSHALVTTNGVVNAVSRDSSGYYIQGTYKLPTYGTKIGVAYGQSTLKLAAGETLVASTGGAYSQSAAGVTTGQSGSLVKSNNMLTVGVYHPLTKSLNLVAEYNKTESKNQSNLSIEDNGVSLGAILFF